LKKRKLETSVTDLSTDLCNFESPEGISSQPTDHHEIVNIQSSSNQENSSAMQFFMQSAQQQQFDADHDVNHASMMQQQQTIQGLVDHDYVDIACSGSRKHNTCNKVDKDNLAALVDSACLEGPLCPEVNVIEEGLFADDQCIYVDNDVHVNEQVQPNFDNIDLLQEILDAKGQDSGDKYDEHYILVSKSCLMELLKTCQVPGCMCDVEIMSEITVGACCKFLTKCDNGHVRLWASSKLLHDVKKAEFTEINVMLSAAILLSGNNFNKIQRLFEFLSIPLFSRMTYSDICSLYIHPVIANWQQCMQQVLFKHIGNGVVALSGDGRADSPGFCAQYCLYSFVYDKYVLHAELVDKRETKLKSTNMEKEACIRGLIYLLKHIKISMFCTDAHPQIKCMLKSDERFCNIVHQFDIFHESVKLNAKLLELGNQRGNSALLNWVPSIRNHFWHCAESCNGDVDKLVEMWISVLRHVIGEHVWHDGQCDHEIADDEDTSKYLDSESAVMEGLRQIVLDKRRLQNMKYYANFMHTFVLESFHNEILVYASKRISFGYEGMQARCNLAMLDHNFHQDRPLKRNKAGNIIYSRKWSKRTKRWTSVTVKEKKSFCYIPHVMYSILKLRTMASVSYKKAKKSFITNVNHPKQIAANLAEYPGPSSSDLAKVHASRFGKKKTSCL
jgi:hypothetical protein